MAIQVDTDTTERLVRDDTDYVYAWNGTTNYRYQLTVLLAGFQATEPTLTALAAYNTNGLLTQTAADTFTGRTITGTAFEITVADGNGVAGNPTLSLASTLDLTTKVVAVQDFSFFIEDNGDPTKIAQFQTNGISTATTRTFTFPNADGTLALTSDLTGTAVKPTESLIVACSDETTAITTGTAKVTFRMPYAFTLSAVRASVTTAPTGSTIIIDINEAGSTILSTKLSIDASEKTSTTAASAAVISDTSLADDSEITIDFDQVGSTIAGTGVKVTLIGTRT